MELNDNGVKVSRTASDISASSSSDELTASSSDSCVTIGSINGNTITLNGGASVGSSTITVSYGSHTATCSASVVVTPTETSVANANSSTSITTNYGKVDVIWLSGTGNTVASTPNAPELNGMTPVSWTKSGDTWTEDATTQTTYYNYTAGTGNTDNTLSMWANAKNTTTAGDSYFVWIPRYAYRIIYYDKDYTTDTTAKIIGYYDGWGMWKAEDGSVKYKLSDEESTIETVDYGGNKYIVHPAFCNGTTDGYGNGQWSAPLKGFWVAKYEMSQSTTDATKAVSIPAVASWRSINIGNCYTTSYNYDRGKESHLMKNSEWGAVAYLTQSQYGRNGHEININNSSSYITGNGGESTSASSTSEAPNPYNTTTGAKASTTGNVYGVYDMSGGAWEYVAAFNNTDTNNYESSYGSTFASTSGTSDKYATKYYNETTSSNGNARIYTYGKIGDATKEVNKGGAYALSNTSTYYNWFGDYPHLCYASGPFVGRGGSFDVGAGAGVFSSGGSGGVSYSDVSFRAVLCP